LVSLPYLRRGLKILTAESLRIEVQRTPYPLARRGFWDINGNRGSWVEPTGGRGRITTINTLAAMEAWFGRISPGVASAARRRRRCRCCCCC